MTASRKSGVSFSPASAACPSISPMTSTSPLNSGTASSSGSPRTTSRTKAPATRALTKVLVRRAKALMNLSELYRAYGEDSETGARARQLLEQQHWYSSIAEFDPKTGAALPLGFDAVLRRQAGLPPQASAPGSICVRDRLWRIVDHSRTS